MWWIIEMVVPLGKVLGWLYLLGKWVNPFASKASGFGGVPGSFPSSLAIPLPSSGLTIFLSSNENTHYNIIGYY